MSEAGELLLAEDVEAFRVLIDARTRHADLWPLVKQMGSQKALANAIGIDQCRVGEWLNLKTVPNPTAPGHAAAIEKLHTITGKTFEELWPPALRAAIRTGRAAIRKDLAFTTSLLQLAERQAERLMLPPADEEVIEADGSEALEAMLSGLTARERDVIKLRFGVGDKDGRTFTLVEVGVKLGMSGTRVLQIEAKAIRKMRDRARQYPVLREFAAEIDRHEREASEIEKQKNLDAESD